jgi:sulfur-carrier protein
MIRVILACEQDLSHEQPGTPLPAPVADGIEPYLIVGAMAGG